MTRTRLTVRSDAGPRPWQAEREKLGRFFDYLDHRKTGTLSLDTFASFMRDAAFRRRHAAAGAAGGGADAAVAAAMVAVATPSPPSSRPSSPPPPPPPPPPEGDDDDGTGDPDGARLDASKGDLFGQLRRALARADEATLAALRERYFGAGRQIGRRDFCGVVQKLGLPADEVTVPRAARPSRPAEKTRPPPPFSPFAPTGAATPAAPAVGGLASLL